MSDWISVDDLLPKKDRRYLICRNSIVQELGKIIDIAYFCTEKKRFYFIDENYEYCYFHDVTHWMPLPELPTVEEDFCEACQISFDDLGINNE